MAVVPLVARPLLVLADPDLLAEDVPTTVAVTCTPFGASSAWPSPPTNSTSGWKVFVLVHGKAVHEELLALLDAVLLPPSFTIAYVIRSGAWSAPGVHSSQMNARAVVFDLFGTLIDDRPPADYAVFLAERRGSSVSIPTRFARLWHATRRRALHEADRGVLRSDLRRARRRRLLAQRSRSRLRADARAARARGRTRSRRSTELRRRGFRLGMISNARASCPALWAESGFEPHFDAVAVLGGRADDEARPPAATSGWPSCSASRRRDCVFVGDGAYRELQGAEAAGMTRRADPGALRRVGARRDDRLGRAARLLAVGGASPRLRRRRLGRRRGARAGGLAPPAAAPRAATGLLPRRGGLIAVRLGAVLAAEALVWHVDRRADGLGGSPAPFVSAARLPAVAGFLRPRPPREPRRVFFFGGGSAGGASSAAASASGSSGTGSSASACPRRPPPRLPASSSVRGRRGSLAASSSSAAPAGHRLRPPPRRSAVFADVLDLSSASLLVARPRPPTRPRSLDLRSRDVLGLLRPRGARRLLGLRLGSDRLVGSLRSAVGERCVRGSVQHPLDPDGDLLADELGRAADHDRDSRRACRRRRGVVAADLDELQLDRLALASPARRRARASRPCPRRAP